MSDETVDGVGAVVVTFHPEESVEEHLKAVRQQVNCLVVVDNGSSVHRVEWLRRICSELDAELIENRANLGIASALNFGVGHAQSLGVQWIMLFDQDSCVTEGCVQTMLYDFEHSGWGARLGILVPRYHDRRLHTDIPQERVQEGLEAAITSGSLIRASTFVKHGAFVDALFIDAVDYEFSLRLRRAGYVIDQCESAMLLHAPGAPVVHSFLGRKRFRTANYSPVRRYYQERNKVWVTRRYLRSFPAFCAKLFFYSVKDAVKILLAEPDKWIKCRFMLRGFFDGLRERMGPLRLPPKAERLLS